MKRQKLHSKRPENRNRGKNRDNSDRSELEHYKGLLRSAEKEIKSLRQQLRYYEKYGNEHEDESIETDDNVHIEQKYLKPCHECGKGFMEEFEIIGKIYGTCNICGHRERLK